MIVKTRKRKDSIQKLQEDKILNLEKQSKYLESLLTATLPKYYEQKTHNDEQVTQNVVQAKRLYFADSPSNKFAKISNEPQSPIRLRKKFTIKTQSPKGILKSPTFKDTKLQKQSPNKPLQPKILKNQKILHPYSILIKLEKSQQKLPEQQKILYQYRKIHDLKQYSETQIDQMIDDLLNRSKISDDVLNKSKASEGNQKLSVTDQFILSRFFDIKIRKAIQKKKQPKEQKKVEKFKPPSRQDEKKPNPELMKAFQEIKFVWNFYQLKLRHCPDLVKGNQKDESIYGEVKLLYMQLMTLGDQIGHSRSEGQQKGDKNLLENKRKVICHPRKLTEEVIAKKIKKIIKKFKDILISN